LKNINYWHIIIDIIKEMFRVKNKDKRFGRIGLRTSYKQNDLVAVGLPKFVNEFKYNIKIEILTGINLPCDGYSVIMTCDGNVIGSSYNVISQLCVVNGGCCVYKHSCDIMVENTTMNDGSKICIILKTHEIKNDSCIIPSREVLTFESVV